MFTGKDFIYNPADFEDKWEKVDNRKKKTPVNFSESKITVQEPIKNTNTQTLLMFHSIQQQMNIHTQRRLYS